MTTKQTQHTPEPWGYDKTTLSIVRLIITPEEVGAWQISPTAKPNNVIAYVPSDYAQEEQLANARLIAAAPALLAACEEWLALWLYIRENYPEVDLPFSIRNGADACGRLRAAVAAATGVR